MVLSAARLFQLAAPLKTITVHSLSLHQLLHDSILKSPCREFVSKSSKRQAPKRLRLGGVWARLNGRTRSADE